MISYSPLLSKYQEMINDGWRNDFFNNALQKHAKNKTVLEVGTGTGILVAYALEAGADFVYSFEARDEIAALADSVLSKLYDRSRFKIISGDFWQYYNKSGINKNSIDLLMTETVGPALFEDDMLRTWFLANTLLKDDAISIPDTLGINLYVWKNTKLMKHLLAKPNMLDKNAIKLDKFVKALTQEPINHYWMEINQYNKPDFIYNDKIKLTRQDIITPRPELKFTHELEKGDLVSIIGDIRSEDNTIYVKDALYMPWKNQPIFDVKESGTYEFSFNYDRMVLSPTTWKIKRV